MKMVFHIPCIILLPCSCSRKFGDIEPSPPKAISSEHGARIIEASLTNQEARKNSTGGANESD
jgi:hypothetical protein